jgi:hypothetical protein
MPVERVFDRLSAKPPGGLGGHRCSAVISDALPFGRLWYAGANTISNAIDYAKFYSRSHREGIRVYDGAGKVLKRTSTQAISKSPRIALESFLIAGWPMIRP